MEADQKKFRLQGKQFFLTYPRCGATKEALLAFLQTLGTLHGGIDRYRVCAETHQDGTPHLHAYVSFYKKVTVTNCYYFDFEGYHGSYETVRSRVGALRYISKHGDYIENFDTSSKLNSMLLRKRDISKELMAGRPLHQVTDDNPELLFGYKKLKQDIEQYQLDKAVVPAIYPRTCYWIYGEPGIGKSYYVRSLQTPVYQKPQNKWWDGYANEDIVLLDDLDSDQMGHLLKIWADGYSFIAETKGGSFRPKYTTLYVTSNYLPEGLFKDPVLASAVRRRFKIMTINDNRELVNWE